MSLALKITYTPPGSNAGTSKVIKFAPNMSVLEAGKGAQEKFNIGGPDHGLFQPAVEGKRAARWLKDDRTLAFYDLQNNDELIYKKKHRALKVKLPDETIKTILIDETTPISDIVKVIGEKVNISNSDEFSLKQEGENQPWLNSSQTIPEQGIADDQILLFKRKYVVTGSVTQDDPMALHMVYVESRDAILQGNHPCTLEEATLFGALQMQVQLGSFDPANPKKFAAKDFLPSQYHKKAKGMEEKMQKEHKKLVGMTDLNAKYRYVQLCRSLKTFGITFFEVKEKGKKGKPKPVYFGVTRDGLLFLDYETKEVIREFPLTHMKRWAASPSSFTIDLGDHYEDYMVLLTEEGEAISSLLSGYIDILLRRRNETAVVNTENDSNVATEEPLAPIRAQALMSMTMSTGGGSHGNTGMENLMGVTGQAASKSGQGALAQRAVPTNLPSAMNYASLVMSDLQQATVLPRNTALTPQQWKKQVIGSSEQLMASVAKLVGVLPPNQLDKALLDSRASEIATLLGSLVTAARNALSGKESEEDVDLLLGAKKVADAIKEMLAASRDLADKPNDPQALERFNNAQKALQSATAFLNSASNGTVVDAASQRLITESAKNVLASLQDLMQAVSAKKDPKANALAEQAVKSGEQLNMEILSLAPAMLNMGIQKHVNDSAAALETILGYLRVAAKIDNEDPNSPLGIAARAVSDAIHQLLATTRLAEPKDFNPDFTMPAKEIFDETARISGAEGNPEQINTSTRVIVAATTKLVGAARAAATTSDEDTKNQLLDAAKNVAEATRRLVACSGAASANPDDHNTHLALQDACQRLVEATQALVGDSASKAAVSQLRSNAKLAAAATTALVSSARTASANCSDPTLADNLRQNSKNSAATVAAMVSSLLNAWQKPNDPSAQAMLLKQAKECSPISYKLVASAKSAVPKITDANQKNNLRSAADDAAEALQKLVQACQQAIISSGAAEIEQAFDSFAAEEAALEAALIDCASGNVVYDPSQSVDGALSLLHQAIKDVSGSIKNLTQGSSDQLGANSKALALAVTKTNTAAKTLAAAIYDKQIQQEILEASKALTKQARNALNCARAAVSNPQDPSLSGALLESAKGVAHAVTMLLSASKGGQSGGRECDEAIATVGSVLERLTIGKGNTKDFPAHSEELEINIKAVSAAVASLVNAAKNNPKLVGTAAKTTAATIAPLVESASIASGSCPVEPVKKLIVEKTRQTGGSIQSVLAVAKNAVTKGDPASQRELSEAAKVVSDSLTELMSALNAATPGQKTLDDASRLLTDATMKLQSPWELSEVETTVQIEEIKKANAKVGDALKMALTYARTDIEKFAPQLKEAAYAVLNVATLSKALADTSQVSSFNDNLLKIKESAEELAKYSESMDPNDKPNALKAAKDLTAATQGVGEQIKSKLSSGTLNAQQAQGLQSAIQKIAVATQQVVITAKEVSSNKPGAKENMPGALQNLNNALDGLQKADPDKQPSLKAKKLIAASLETATSSQRMVDISKNLLKHPNEPTIIAELNNSARGVGNGIKSTLDSAKAMSEIDLDEFISKISQSISELESAAISATVGLLENTAPLGKTSQDLEEELVQVSRDLANGIKRLVQAQRESATSLVRAARDVGTLIPKLAEIAKFSAGSISDPQKQSYQLESSKTIAQDSMGLMQACKQNDPKEIGNSAKNASQNIVNLLSSLKGGVIALRDCDDAAKSVGETAQNLTGFSPAFNPKKNYGDSQRLLGTVARDLVTNIAKLIQNAKNNSHEVGETSKKIATVVNTFANVTTDALSSITDEEALTKLHHGSVNVANATNRIILSAKLVAADSKNTKNQQKLSSSHKDVTEAIAEFIAAVKAAATGELKAEAAMDLILRDIAEIDSAALHAATGELQPESDDLDIEEVQAAIINECKSVAEEVKHLLGSVEKSQSELGGAATVATEKLGKLSKNVKNGASLLSTLAKQQELLQASKNIGSALHGLITAALAAQKNSTDQKARGDLAVVSKKMTEGIKELVTVANNISSAAGLQGLRELELARRAIAHNLAEFDNVTPNPSAAAVEVLKAAKGVADSIGAIMGNQEDPAKIIKAASDASSNIQALMQNSKGAIRLTDTQNGTRLIDAVKNVSDSTVSFLEAAKVNKKQQTPVSLQNLSEASEDVVKMIGAVVEASKVLPGSEEALKLFQQADELESLAEKELLHAANTIDEATRTLMEAKQRQIEMRKNKDSPLPEEEITEAILEAARAIASATATLVSAATSVQKELIAKGRVSQSNNVYRRDPAWAKGLISAAQSVAGSVKDLVGAANTAAQGQAAEEALVASAKGVAAATTRLVMASRTKADPFSPTQQSLNNAAKTVALATSQLVQAAQSVVNPGPEEVKPEWNTPETQTGLKKAELEAQMRILKLQKDLESAQTDLFKLRKADYADAAKQSQNTNAPAPAKTFSGSFFENKAYKTTAQTGPAPQPVTRPLPLANPNANANVNAPAPVSRPLPPPNANPGSTSPPAPVKIMIPAKNVGPAPPTKVAIPLPVPKVVEAPGSKFYAYDYLKNKPANLDRAKLELYLSDEDFQSVFGKDKATFAKLPPFVQNSEKAKVGL